ncbi:MAG TPA: demethoxyubiquinone hydroxylase family protein [Micropepsaceae bacterium]|nr:demethoxyubiquinone hydroxylase family protein [Micropepsaceae bacterium]
MHGTGAGRGNRPALPGTQKPRASEIEAMIRVDHAGELGAVCIYEGQLAVLSRQKGAVEDVQSIRHMAAQEQGHFDIFDAMVKDRAVRPTALEPVWRVAGFALGAATALMGRKAAMACTVAVEDVIDEHYSRQIDHLGASEPELKRTIQKFHADECAHRDAALERGAEQAPAYPLLSAAIRFSCRVAIALSERV